MEGSREEDTSRGQRRHGLALLVALNTLINGVLNAAIAYGIGWLLANPFEISWYEHEPDAMLEQAFVVGDLALAAALTALAVTGIVGWLVYRSWDHDQIEPTSTKLGLITSPRDRGRHLWLWAGVQSLVLALLVLAGGEIAFRAAAAEELAAGSFPALRAAVGGLVGAIVGGLVTWTAVVNLSHGKLTKDESGANSVARISLWSSRNPRKVLAVVLLLTLFLGSGLADVHTSVDVADVLPRGNPHSEAAHNLTDRFKSTYTQEMEFQFRIDPEQCQRDSESNLPMRPAADTHCGNITDEVYVRAMDEFFRFVQDYEYEKEGLPWEDEETISSPIRYQIALPTFYKLLNWTSAGGQDDAPPDAFSLPSPRDRARMSALRESGWQLLRDTFTPTMDPSLEQAVALYMVEPTSNMSSQDIGRFGIEARDAYVEWAPENAMYKVFTGENKPLHTVDLPVANAHSSTLAEEDFRAFLPLIAVFLVVALYLLFRNITSVFVAATSLGLGVVWTYGLMGHADIALNNLNLTILPLIMGSGIDYSIHMVNEFLEHKSEGASDEEAFTLAGERAGLAMFIATLVTISGLVIMALSPSTLLAELGFLAIVAISSIYLLTVSFIPAALSMVGNTEHMGANFRPSRLVPKIGEVVCRHRVVFVVLALLITAGSVVGLQQLTVEEFGEPALNWPEEDWMRQEHVEGLQGFYDVGPDEPVYKANAIVVEGDITDPATHEYLDDLSASLQAQSLQSDTIDMHTSRNLPFIIRSWLKVCCGPQSLVLGSLSEELEMRGYQEYSQYPATRAQIESTLDEMFASPYATFASLFVDHPNNDITVMTISVRTGDFESAEQAWQAVTTAIERAEGSRPADVHTAFVGNTPTNYLFSSEQLPWLNYMSIGALAAALLLVFAFTRDLRATLAVGAVVGLTSLWVLGMLPYLGIGLAITLMLPLVFIFSIGSDYAVHMVWNIKQVGDAHRVYATVGKAVLFSAVTDIGAFALLAPIPGIPRTGIRDLMVRDAIVATIVAIGVIFIATVVLISLFYDVTPQEAGEQEPRGLDRPAHGHVGSPKRAGLTD